MPWEDEVQRLLAVASARLAGLRPTDRGFHRAVGFEEGLQKALELGPAGLRTEIARAEETARIQREVLLMSEGAGPRLYRQGELEALRMALGLARTEGDEGA